MAIEPFMKYSRPLNREYLRIIALLKEFISG
jgi:hypothetical protein